jgi:SAM-dependent methyltransferase
MKHYFISLIKNIFRLFSPPRFLKDLPTVPISEYFGLERGTPIDRFYIEYFLKENAVLIKGKVVEIAENTYTSKYGNDVTSAEILHIDENFSDATIIADLSEPSTIPENWADVFICTQTLNFIYDIAHATESIHKILKPNGKAIITVAGLSQISRFDMDRWGDYWRFTDKSLYKLLSKTFGEKNIEIKVFGNSFAATMLIQGIALEEVEKKKLLLTDTNYQLIIGVVATKQP